MTGNLVSPLSAGGAGVRFELRAGAIMLSRMFRGGPPPVGPVFRIDQVSFQQRNNGYPLDDIVIAVGQAGQVPTARMQFQVKRSIRIADGDDEFRKFMAAAVQACDRHVGDAGIGRTLLGLVAGGPREGLSRLRELTELARSHRGQKEFESLFRPGVVSLPLRTMLNRVSDAVGRAAEYGSGSEAEVGQLTYRLLASLHVWHVLAEDDDDPDWRRELTELEGYADETGLTAATLMGGFQVLASSYAAEAASVTADRLQRDLQHQFGAATAAFSGFPRDEPGPQVGVAQQAEKASFAQLRQMWDSMPGAGAPANARGHGLEAFTAALFGTYFEIVGIRLQKLAGEVDVVRGHRNLDLFWANYPGDIWVECKNTEDPTPAAQVNVFLAKLMGSRSRLGFFVSVAGFTDDATEKLKSAARNPAFPLIVSVTRKDVTDFLAQNTEPSEFFKSLVRKFA